MDQNVIDKLKNAVTSKLSGQSDLRRNVIKRRLKAEIIGKKKIGKFDENSEEAKEFEESLLKLANLAKNRVKFSEFTS